MPYNPTENRRVCPKTYETKTKRMISRLNKGVIEKR